MTDNAEFNRMEVHAEARPLRQSITPSLEEYANHGKMQRTQAAHANESNELQITPLNYGSAHNNGNQPSYANEIHVQSQSHAIQHNQQNPYADEIHVNQHSYAHEVHVQAQSHANQHNHQHPYVDEIHVRQKSNVGHGGHYPQLARR